MTDCRYVGSPIQCWAPMEFRGGWEQYAEDYCFIQNTFYIPFEQEIPTDVQDRQDVSAGTRIEMGQRCRVLNFIGKIRLLT